jgi:hypothetical protein
MSHIDQTRGFEDRLKDFGPELGPFLKAVWEDRANLKNKSDRDARDRIYAMYSGNAQAVAFDEATLADFITRLRRLVKHSPGCEIHCQGMDPKNLDDYDDIAIDIQGHDLWNTFFHVIDTQRASSHNETTARVYVHAINWASGLEIMKRIVGEFGKNTGLWEVKTAGPGEKRLDTIVAYFYDSASRDALVQFLVDMEVRHPGWFAVGLPPLVKQRGKGIGSADEPPQIKLVRGGDRRHSFGSFYAAIFWLALKTTPNLLAPKEEPRHFLDNVLYSLRLLQVNPADPQQFPAKSVLEAWYKNAFVRAKATGGP